MENMDHWSVALLVVAGYVVVMSLVRLMLWRRDQLHQEFHRRMEAEKARQAKAAEAERLASRKSKKAA
jgi:cytochrome c-type biogenesis protein CcmH/NrfG